ncbi:polyphenol oxidase family protein [Candidatus Uhrbacteria bacterium]|nr:polyphenol oxidase family protein [Candidatus Uhrbacteria bacterium]
MKDIYTHRGLKFFGTTVEQGNFAPPLSTEPLEHQMVYTETLQQVIVKATGVDVDALAMARLCHGNTIGVFQTPGIHAVFPMTDGLVTNVSGTALIVTGADCPPVLLHDSKKGVIGLAHSGREGTYKNISFQLMHCMQVRFKCLSEDIHAVIGPGICQNHYQVSSEMARTFFGFGFDISIIQNGYGYLHLKKMIYKQLVELGIMPERILVSSDCTFSAEGIWHSFRRDKQQGILRHNERPRSSAFVAIMS